MFKILQNYCTMNLYCTTVWTNYGTMDKLWYYGYNYGTIPRTMELRFTMEKTLQITKNKKILFIMEKPKVTYQKN